MKIALITDAWVPQMNGVVHSLASTNAELCRRGHSVAIISPEQFRSIPCPSYPEIRLALARSSSVGQRLDALDADAIHIATEGPLGFAARRYCLSHQIPFTTAYHTHFPDYLARRTGLPPRTFWPYIRWFHAPSQAVMVATESVRAQLREHGLANLAPWSRGVDLSVFRPDLAPPDLFLQLERPIQLYVGRVAPEKNLEAFLANSYPGSKVVVGDGPALAKIRAMFPSAYFLGRQRGGDLAACYAGADVFVFPSRTDTFGLVLIEALACGTPVAAFPVSGPLDVLTRTTGTMDEDLAQAIAGALTLRRDDCAAHACRFSWQASADQFLAALAPRGGSVDQPKTREYSWRLSETASSRARPSS